MLLRQAPGKEPSCVCACTPGICARICALAVQELLGLSTSLLEKEQMLKSAGLGEAHDSAVARASRNVLMEELEEIKTVKCKV